MHRHLIVLLLALSVDALHWSTVIAAVAWTAGQRHSRPLDVRKPA